MPAFLRPGNLIALIILAAVGIAALVQFGAAPWSGGAPDILSALGRLTGVLGAVMMLLSAVISIRLPRFDVPFGGITELWKTHHVLGAGALLLLMAHPVLLALARLSVSPRAAATVLLPAPSDTGSLLGWAALLSMMVFLAPTFFLAARKHYQRWKSLHAVSGIAVALGVAHSLVFARTFSEAVWWALSFGALAALAFRLIWRRVRRGRRFVVAGVHSLNGQVVELSLAPAGGPPMRYAPGQFIYLAPLDESLASGRGEEHPYTITSAPSEPVIRTAIKDLGDATHALQQVRQGTAAWIDGPYGRFFHPGENRAEVWIGGGIGIAPFVGRARTFAGRRLDYEVNLVYCTDRRTGPYFLDELEAIAKDTPGFCVQAHFFDERGPLSGEILQAFAKEFAQREVYICGPESLVQWAAAYCREAGVPAKRIHSEAFGFL